MHKAFVCGLNQLLRSFLHISDVEGFVKVAVETVVVDCDVHCVSEKKREGCVSSIVLHDKMDCIIFGKHKEASVMNKHLLTCAVGEHQFK